MITLDWDNTNKKQFESKIKRVKEIVNHLEIELKKEIKIEYRKSCSKKGYHIKIKNLVNCYMFRTAYYDDLKRISIDIIREQQGLPINVLFDRKVYPDGEIKKAGKWKVLK